MLGNIWLSSALIVTAIFSASAMYKSYSDIQEAKQIQEHYEIVSEIKTLIAKQYNKNPNEITRDEIIAHLPDGENWEKVLLLDRNKDSHLSNKELVNEDGDIQISKDEKLKLLALKSKLKDIADVTAMTTENDKYTFKTSKMSQNIVLNDIAIKDSVEKAIHFLGVEILYSGVEVQDSELQAKLTTIINEFTPSDKMYQDFRTTSEITSDTILTPEEILTRKKAYFKSKIKEKLLLNETATETKLYIRLKEYLND